MASSNFNLVGLDFDTIKSNLITYLRSNSQFKDADFEGSNLSVLVDVMAYNTYLNSFYTNMVGSEMWLDSAQLRNSVVSHAKELNYVPRSYTSSQVRATVDITPTSSVQSIVVPRYTAFSTRVGSNTYTFTTNEAVVLTQSTSGTFTFTTDLYEGVVLKEAFVYDSSLANQRFVLSNDTVDTKTIEVSVYEDNGVEPLTYVQAYNLIGITAATPVFFVQAAEDTQYEIVFGDGNFGRRPKSGSTIVVTYRSTAGELPNGASSFISDGLIDGHANVVVQTLTTATGGAVAETTESIRFNAPRAFVTQGRAVTARDYETILKARFPEIQAVSVYGGEENFPPKYGTVFISTDVYGADGTSVSSQNKFLSYLDGKMPLTTRAEFIDPDFLHVDIETKVQFDITKTSKTTNDIKLAVAAAISNFGLTELNDFNTTMYYSKLTTAIDAADSSIIGSDTTATAVKRLQPNLNEATSFIIELNAPLQQETGRKLRTAEAHYGHTITSTDFVSEGLPVTIVDDSLGKLYLAATSPTGIQIIKETGTVDYVTGRVMINDIIVSSILSGGFIKVYLKTESKNITCKKNVLITLSSSDVNVTVTGVNPQ